jgi:hypothetical protein
MEGNKRYIYFEDNSKVPYFILNESEKDSVLRTDVVKDTLNQDQNLNLTVVKLSSGKVLQTMGNTLFILIASEIDYVKINSKGMSADFMEGLNLYEDKLLSNRDKLFETLSVNLNIKSNLLDGSVLSLQRIDTSLNHIDITADFIDQNFSALVVYIGDVYIKARGGQWKMVHREGKVWAPILLDRNGNEVFLADQLYDNMQQSLDQSIPLSAFLMYYSLP